MKQPLNKIRCITDAVAQTAINGASSAGGALLGGFFGLGMTKRNNEAAAEREEAARRQNYYFNEMAANAADARTRALYNDLYSPKAQWEQMQELGMSPSLMASGLGGMSGQSGSQGSGAAGITPNVFGLDPMAAANIAKTMAETDLLKSKTRTENGGNERGQSEIAKNLAEAGYQNAATNYTKSLEKATQLQNYITSNTAEFSINKAHAEAESAATYAQKAVYDLLTSQMECQKFAETYDDQIRAIKIGNDLNLSQKLLNQAKTKNTNTDTERIKAEIDKWSEELAQGWANVGINAFKANTEKERNEIFDNYFDGQIEQLEKRLNFDKEKFSKEFKYQCITYGITTYNQQAQAFFDDLISIIPFVNKDKPKPIGFRFGKGE